MERRKQGLCYFPAVTVGGRSTGGSFYLYAPAVPHDFDILSNCLNGVIFLYPDKGISGEAEAEALLKRLGLDAIAESFPAYILMPCPMKGEAWTEQDAELFWESQFWLAGGQVDMEKDPPQGEYPRHTMNTLQYVIAEGRGASFFNNVLSKNAQRVAGAALFGGDMAPDAVPGPAVPVYLVEPSETALAYWKHVNGVDSFRDDTFYNSSYEQKKVILAPGEAVFDPVNIRCAWDRLLSRSMKLGVEANIVLTTMDRSDWVLMDWFHLADIGLHVRSFQWDEAAETAYYYPEYKTKNEDSVHIYIPDAVEKSPDKAVPLLVALHGRGDDPLNIVLGCGWAKKAVEEEFIILAPAKEEPDYVMKLINYVCSICCIDRRRIYCTGFSMGGMNTSNLGKAYPEVFAAIAPMGSAGGSYVEGFDNEAYDLPVCMVIGGSDPIAVQIDGRGRHIVSGFEPRSIMQAFEINGIDPGEKDYDRNDYWGYEPHRYEERTDKDLQWRISSFCRSDFQAPLVQCVTLVGAGHSNADYMAQVAWDFMRPFARGADGKLLELAEE